MINAEFAHLLRKARDAQRGGIEAWRVQSTGERVAVALVLNRADWLTEMGYTLAEAVDRTGGEWCALLLMVERALHNEREASGSADADTNPASRPT